MDLANMVISLYLKVKGVKLPQLDGKRVVVLTANGFEDMELIYPLRMLRQAGCEVDVASISKGIVKGKRGEKVEANLSFGEVNPKHYDALLIPGGKAPAEVRKVQAAIDLVKYFFETDKPVAAICHGPQILVSAGVVKNRRMTSNSGVKDELEEAGANFIDCKVVMDGRLITSRHPFDLPDFVYTFALNLLDKNN
jgi:protease I